MNGSRARDDWRQDGVEDRDQERRDERAPEALDRDTGDDGGRDEQRRGTHEPRDDEPDRAECRPLGMPRHCSP